MNVTIFGDSHARYFFCTPLQLRRMSRFRRPFEIRGQPIDAASIAGFRPGRTTLGTKEIIADALAEADLLVLAFGQVDLELGYYYRLCIKGEALTPGRYVNWLIGLYDDFVSGLGFPRKRVLLKGVNLTVLTEKQFAVGYISRIIDETAPEAAAKTLQASVLDEAVQNAMHLNYNDRLRAFAEGIGAWYFDINQEIRNHNALLPRIDGRFLPAQADHHVADTLATRNIHLYALEQTVTRARRDTS